MKTVDKPGVQEVVQVEKYIGVFVHCRYTHHLSACIEILQKSLFFMRNLDL